MSRRIVGSLVVAAAALVAPLALSGCCSDCIKAPPCCKKTAAAPAPAPAPAPQQSSAGSAPPAAAGSTPSTASSGTAPPAAPGPPATGVSAPVQVPATDFAAHAVKGSATQAPSAVARAVPRTSASAGADRPAVVATLPPARRVVRSQAHGQAAARRDTRARASTRAVAAPATRGAVRPSVTRSPRALRGGEPSDVVLPVRRSPEPASSSARASRSTRPASPGWLLSRAPLAGAALAPLLLALGALLRRRRVAPAAPPRQDAIVLTLPLSPRPEHLREGERLAA